MTNSIISYLFPAYSNNLAKEVENNLAKSFKETDAFFIRLLLLHWAVASTVTAFSYGTYLLGFAGGGLVTGVAYLAYRLNPGSLWSRMTMGAALMAFSMIFIQQHMGRIEMHFHVFLAIAFLIRYKDIAPVLSAALTIALHHVLFGIAQNYEMVVAGTPIMVFDYGCSWQIVALHAIFVVVETIVISNIILNLTNEYLDNAEIFNILDDLNDSANRTSKATNVISSSSQELAVDATENTEAVTESNKSIGNMNDKIEELNDKTASVKEKVMNITDNTEQMNESMMELRDSNNNISTITQTIDSIASQTNLLALNAAVEAARAGEAGAGFAVVTEEIRSLAQKTAESANNIREMIRDNIEKTERSAKASAKISKQVTELLEWIKDVHDMSSEQLDHLKGLENAIAQISETTENTADLAEDNASTAEELQGEVHLLYDAIEDVNTILLPHISNGTPHDQ